MYSTRTRAHVVAYPIRTSRPHQGAERSSGRGGTPSERSAPRRYDTPPALPCLAGFPVPFDPCRGVPISPERLNEGRTNGRYSCRFGDRVLIRIAASDTPVLLLWDRSPTSSCAQRLRREGNSSMGHLHRHMLRWSSARPGPEGNVHANAPIERLYPDVKSAATEIPETARTYLQQHSRHCMRPMRLPSWPAAPLMRC